MASAMSLRAARAALRKIGQGINVKPHQGARETERRRRQMLAGKLHVSTSIPETVEPVAADPVPEFMFP